MDTSIESDSSAAGIAKSGLLCPLTNCRKRFKKAKKMLKHFRRCHPTKWLLVCNCCSSYVTRNVGNMSRHLRENHSEESCHVDSVCHSSHKLNEAKFSNCSFSVQYSCTLCSFNTNQVYDFNVHSETHSVCHSDNEETSHVNSDTQASMVSEDESHSESYFEGVQNTPSVESEVSSPDTEASKGSKSRKRRKGLKGVENTSGVKSEVTSPDVETSTGHKSRKRDRSLDAMETSWSSLDLNGVENSRNESSGAIYPCPVCGKYFTRERSIRCHMVVHTDERLFHCSRCPYKARRKGDLCIHINKTHENQKPFACNLCTKLCGSQTDLKRHLLSHSEERLFKCDQCDARFKYKCSAVKHLKRGLCSELKA